MVSVSIVAHPQAVVQGPQQQLQQQQAARMTGPATGVPVSLAAAKRAAQIAAAAAAAAPAPSDTEDSHRDSASQGGRSSSHHDVETVIDHQALGDMALDKDGSRRVQAILEDASPKDVEQIYQSLRPWVARFMTDIYANYVVQKIVEHHTPEVMLRLLEDLTPCLIEMSVHAYGCRIVQKVLDHCTPQQALDVAAVLMPHALSLTDDQNANHVIQKAVQVVPGFTQELFAMFNGAAVEYAAHAYGCRVVQRMLEYCTCHDTAAALLTELLSAVHGLASDPYGNYVVQHMLLLSHSSFCGVVAQRLRGELGRLALHKFASNVVEKVFFNSDEGARLVMLEELTTVNHSHGHGSGKGDPSLGSSPMSTAALHPFGNYVVKSLFNNASPAHKTLMKAHLTPRLRACTASSYSKACLTLLDRYQDAEVGGVRPADAMPAKP